MKQFQLFSDQSVTIRNFVFGVEDSLVSTVGLLSGVAIGGVSQQTILLTGLVLILVEALSMGIGSYLSEYNVAEASGKSTNVQSSAKGGVIMFLSYFVAGFIPLAPYVLAPPELRLFLSISLSLLWLFLLGIISGTIFHTARVKNGLRMLILGGIAVLAGAGVGYLIPAA